MNSLLLAGIDVGGTSTRIALADVSGRVLGRSQALGAGFTEVPAKESARRLGVAWVEACRRAGCNPAIPVSALFAGFGSLAASRDSVTARRCLRAAGVFARRLAVGHDSENAQAGARPDGAGVHVIAGTGSVVVVRGDNGRICRVGGWGPGIGDEGSAWWTACAALRSLAARTDAGREPDALGNELLRALGIREPRELLGAVFTRGLDRAGFAALSRPVLMRASAGDRAARALLAEGAEALGAQVALAARRAGLAAPVVTVSGGMFEHIPGYARRLVVTVRARGIAARLSPTAGCPLAGALLLARRLLPASAAEGVADPIFVRRVADNLSSKK